MRVLYVCQNMVIPVNQQTLSSLSDLQDIEIGLLVPTHWDDREFRTRWNFELHDARISAFPSPIRMSGRVGAYSYRMLDIVKAIRRFRPDLIQIVQESFSLSAWQVTMVARALKVPVCLYVWESVDRSLSLIRRATRRMVLGYASSLATAGTPAAELHRGWGYNGRVDVFPQLGIDPEQFKPVETERTRELKVGFVGRLIPRKGVDALLEAVAGLKRQGVVCTVTICGSGPEENRLKAMANRLGIDKAVHWLGLQPHDRIPAVLAGIDVLAVPSLSEKGWTEQFGHVLIEAMSMEVPPFGSSCGEIPVVIDNPDQIFEENDVSRLQALLRRAHDDPGWRAKIGREGRQRVLSVYSHEQVSERYLAAWEYVLG